MADCNFRLHARKFLLYLQIIIRCLAVEYRLRRCPMEGVKDLIEAARSEGTRIRALALQADDRSAELMDRKADRWFDLAARAETEVAAFINLSAAT